ncbi:MAG: hypothetical protein ABL995_21150 [Bryobacteraceae bacterium]
MWKLKLAWLLPLINVTVAAMLLHLAGPRSGYLPTARLICAGLNAPALAFTLVADWRPLSVPDLVLGFERSDIFFMVGVLIVWFCVGRVIDRHGLAKTDSESRVIIPVLKQILPLCIGAFLLYVGLHDFQEPTFNNLGRRPHRGVLTLAWAGTLICLPGHAIIVEIRRAKDKKVG